MIDLNFISAIAHSLRENWSLPLFTNYEEGKTFTAADVAKRAAKIHILLSAMGIEKGDKISLIAKDSAEWCMTWVGVVTYGAVLVPILPSFHPDDIHNIITHSDSKIVFAGKEHIKLLERSKLVHVQAVYDIFDLSPVLPLSPIENCVISNTHSRFDVQYPNGFTPNDIQYPEISNDNVILISYTSGTTGFSKGVMTTANNLAANMKLALSLNILKRGKTMLSFLPNAHSYGCAFNFLLPLLVGCHVYILIGKPVPSVLLKALKDVRPHLILMVPLVLEKIYKNVIAPKINQPAMKLALMTPGVNITIYRKIRQTLIDAMGGNMIEVIVGGASLNEEVDYFLSKIKFPYTVGYGMTECAPLIGYAGHKKYVPRSCGRVLDMIEEVRIYDPKEEDGHEVGEIQVRGENVCKGYYKEAELSTNLFTADGWMRTGDLGYLDKNMNIFIQGRSKSMILGSNGQNIYPEEIEAKLIMLPYILDAIVVQRKNHSLVGIVTLDHEALHKDGKNTPDEIRALLVANRKQLNQSISSFAALSEIEVLDGEFEKTPKQSIKRYLYQ